MTANDRDTIYIDIDDEITTIIDKLRGSSGKIVALVLPKRASTLQSIVNMKLLKRAADETKKNVVLVTTESGLLPLAGAVGLHVAKTPSSRPEIPPAPDAMSDAEVQVNETADMLDDDDMGAATAENAGNKSVGELAGAAVMPIPTRPAPDSGIETLELDNEDKSAVGAAGAAAAAKKAKLPKDKKLKVPDFDRFRLLLIGGAALLIILIFGGYMALAVLPKATVNIKTNASNVNTDVDFALSTSATSFNEGSKIVPAKQVQAQKTLTGTAPATGQKNNGQKANGSVTFTSPCVNGVQSVPAGTGLSSGSQTYVTQKAVTMSSASGAGSNCKFSGSTTIGAQVGGAKYNTSDNAKFTLSPSSSGAYEASTITATGSASGGTDDIQTIVSQADIDSAKGKIAATDNSTVQDELKGQLTDQGLYAIAASYSAGTPTTTNSSDVGSAASNVTVTQTYTYTMLGANEAYLKTLVDNDIKGQIDTNAQGILSQGITQASFKLKDANTSGANMNIQTVAEVGPSLDTDQIASAAAGKKSSEIKSDVEASPDVTEVTVKFSPFWVTKAPKNVHKITVIIAKPTKTANAD
ncbi:MAG: hypothetical protein JWN82_70 [Candidatus Saccharibacteria bacterium]|nr:hypothetical protein [Candidatus Saccharibacteria bacterium]